ncbi:MAG: DUF5689 domain-containing protein, partial [Burkholderiales bacterium]|nr:DUF5689 domain-containing protein [Burkholderiales bacterium]
MHLRQFSKVLILPAFLLVSCGEKPVPQSLSLDKTQVTFTAAAGEQAVQVSANCSWSVAVTEGSNWLSVTPGSGQGNATLTLSVQVNTGADRTGAIKVYSAEKEVRITITQKEEETLYWSISQLRALYKGTDVKVTDKVIVKATVISNYLHADNEGLNNYTSMKAIVVSDKNAGIQLFCAENNTDFKQGDKVEIQLQGQT